LSISFQHFSLVMFPVPILKSTFPANGISSSTNYLYAILNSVSDSLNSPISCLFGSQETVGLLVGSSQVNCSVPVMPTGMIEFRISFAGLISTSILMETNACETIIDVHPQKVFVSSSVIVNVKLKSSLKTSVSVCFGQNVIDCFARGNGSYSCLIGSVLIPQNITVSMCHMRCESAPKFELQILPLSNFRVNPSLVQAAGGTLISISGDMLDYKGEWFCRFGDKTIPLQNFTCLSTLLESGSHTLSIMNAQQVIGLVTVTAIPNKIDYLSSSVLLSYRNHSLQVHLSHPLSGSEYHIFLGFNRFLCNPASTYESGYTSFVCFIQPNGPGAFLVKMCGSYCTSESELVVEEPHILTVSTEGCFVGECVIKVFGNPLCESFNIFFFASSSLFVCIHQR